MSRASAHLHIRCTPEDRGRWFSVASRSRPPELTTWVIRRLNEAVARTEGEAIDPNQHSRAESAPRRRG